MVLQHSQILEILLLSISICKARRKVKVITVTWRATISCTANNTMSFADKNAINTINMGLHLSDRLKKKKRDSTPARRQFGIQGISLPAVYRQQLHRVSDFASKEALTALTFSTAPALALLSPVFPSSWVTHRGTKGYMRRSVQLVLIPFILQI